MTNSPPSDTPTPLLPRRDILRGAALGLAAGPLLVSCGDDAPASDAGTTADGGMLADSGAADSGAADSGAADSGTADAGAGDTGGNATTWATGGTAAMVAKASYPAPNFDTSSCLTVSSTTEGPCTTEDDLDREDVSEGWTGLPVRLALKVVDGSCNPLSGVTLKIWHTNLEGVYSGNTPNPGMCSNNDASAIAADYFRGVQTTDSEGVAYFDSCFPGWYRGRAVHVHFQVKDGSTSYQVSQLFFPEDVTEAIFESHPEYSGFGQPDTVFSNDNIAMGVDDISRHVLSVERMEDGAMLAYRVVAVVS